MEYGCPQVKCWAEASNKLVTNVARKMLLQSKLTKGFWPEVVSATVFIRYRMPSKRLKGRSPYPVVAETFQWIPSLPYVGNLRAYDSIAFVYDHSAARGDKFAPRAKKGTLVGQAPQGLRRA